MSVEILSTDVYACSLHLSVTLSCDFFSCFEWEWFQSNKVHALLFSSAKPIRMSAGFWICRCLRHPRQHLDLNEQWLVFSFILLRFSHSVGWLSPSNYFDCFYFFLAQSFTCFGRIYPINGLIKSELHIILISNEKRTIEGFDDRLSSRLGTGLLQ